MGEHVYPKSVQRGNVCECCAHGDRQIDKVCGPCIMGNDKFKPLKKGVNHRKTKTKLQQIKGTP